MKVLLTGGTGMVGQGVLRECVQDERVTNVLRDYLLEYSVDVSSPGLERPVRKPAHFRAAVGRRVALRTRERNRVRGEVVAADERTVTVKTEAESVDIPYDAIVRGNLIEEAGKR